jgi:hypothetical protein
MSSNARRDTSLARRPSRSNTSMTAASRRPRGVAGSQPTMSRLASPAGKADGRAVRGHILSAGTAATSEAATLPVACRNRKKQRSAVTMHRSDGFGIAAAATRTVERMATPSRSATTTDASGCHRARNVATRRTYWSVVTTASPRWVTHQRRKHSRSSTSTPVRPGAKLGGAATTPIEHRCRRIGWKERIVRHRDRPGVRPAKNSSTTRSVKSPARRPPTANQ